MSKSKSIVKEKSVVAPEYTEALYEIIAACRKLYDYSLNPQSEIYRISRFVSVFASQVAYLDYLRDETASIIKSGDTFLIKRQIQKVDWAQECKAWDQVWSEVASMYDTLLLEFDGQSTNDGNILTFKTSSEIMDSARKFYQDKDDNDRNDAIKTLQASLAL